MQHSDSITILLTYTASSSNSNESLILLLAFSGTLLTHPIDPMRQNALPDC